MYKRLVEPAKPSSATTSNVQVSVLSDSHASLSPLSHPDAAPEGGGGGIKAGGLRAVGSQESREVVETFEDLQERIASAQRLYKDEPELLKKAHMEIILQRGTYEREVVLSQILHETCAHDLDVDDAGMYLRVRALICMCACARASVYTCSRKRDRERDRVGGVWYRSREGRSESVGSMLHACCTHVACMLHSCCMHVACMLRACCIQEMME